MISNIIIDILLVNVTVCYFMFGSVNVPNTDKTVHFTFDEHENNFAAASIVVNFLPRSVCWDP